MRRIKFLLQYFVLPPFATEALKSLMQKIAFNLKYITILSENQILEKKHAGQRCFIIGNGPSVKGVDILKLKDEINFCISNGYLHNDYLKIKPKFHFIPSLTYSDKPGGLNETKACEWFSEIKKRTGDAEIVLSLQEYKLVKKHNLFENKKVWWVYYGNILNKNCDMTKPLSKILSAPQMAMQAAIYMGVKKIILIGIEHDDFCTHKYEYFFEPEKMPFKDEAVDDDRRHTESMVKRLSIAKDLYENYEYLKKVATEKGVEIINCTNAGRLDMFKRECLENILNDKCKQNDEI